ncbi:MAG: pitrilysin family protein, partial [Candidatus Hydrogenedentes bacterium]|nr:pitrilysin family protein [Candidatus Hydrogenedentota bacterium]
LWYHVGSKDEDPSRQGFAHMFEHMMFRGTDRLGPTSHFDLVRRAGGRCNGYTSFDQTVYYEALPANQLELALWLEAERMSFLKIDQSAFDTERKVVEEERRLGLNAPYGTLEEEGLAEIFKVHPYRWSPIGHIPDLRASSVPELRAFWTSHYTPNNATLIIAGAVKHEDAQALAKRYFGWIPRCPDPARVTVREPMPGEPRTVVFKQDKAPAPLVGLVYRSVPPSNDDVTALQFLGNILAGGDSSRMYRRIVTELGLAVQISWCDWSLEQDGVFIVGAALSPLSKKYDETLAALEREIETVRTAPVTDRELTKARNQMLRGLVTEELHIGSKASALGEATVIEGDTARVNKRAERIRGITPERLLEVAKKYLDPQRVLRAKVEANLAGLFSKKKTAEDEAPITAQPETNPPPAGRPGVTRPADFPVTPPANGMLEYDPTPHFQTQTLSNGLKVIVVPNHEVPFVSFELGLRAGAWTETKPGSAAMATYMLTKGGTAKHTAEALADELDTYAIWLGGGSSMDDASVSGGCLTEHLERAVNLMAEAVLTPRFDAKAFEKRRKEEITNLTVSEHEPSFIASRELDRRLYGQHPYAREASGRVKDVEALNIKDLKRWWKQFGRPDMAVLYFSGDVELDQALRIAQAAFKPWKAKGAKPETKLPPLPEAQPTRIYLVDKAGD